MNQDAVMLATLIIVCLLFILLLEIYRNLLKLVSFRSIGAAPSADFRTSSTFLDFSNKGVELKS